MIRALAVTAAVAAPAVAVAAPYEAFIDVDSQEDLDDLLASGEIEVETHDALIELLARGVDLDTASREELYSLPNLTYDEVDAILAYRKLQGFVGDPANLVAAGAITEQKLLAMSAFLVVRDRTRNPYAPRGMVEGRVRATPSDDDVPPLAVAARLTVGRHLAAGGAVATTRLRLGDVAWDANRDGFLVDGPGLQVHVPKLYLRYTADHFTAVAGSYRVGFDERVTFDNSSDYTPDGIYRDDRLHYANELARECRLSTGELASSPCSGDYAYETSDFRWSDGLFGIAAGSDHVGVGRGYATAYAWGSYQPKDIYQYEVLDRGACADPYDTSDACSAPPAYVRPEGDVLTSTPATAYQTLPGVYAEALVGAHATYHAARRDYVGVTAYGATTHWLVDQPDGVQLDFQDWSRVPIGGRYGAIGVSAGIGRGIYDGFVEVARSFDRQPDGPGALDGGGGLGAEARFTRSVRKREFELSLRYYDPDYDNPYAGSIAASDEVDGARVRGEHGVRVKYTGVHGQVTLRAAVDLWRGYVSQSDDYLPRVSSYLHVDVQGSDQLAYGVWLDFADKDLTENGYQNCYEVSYVDDERGEPIPCKGMRLKTTGRLRIQPDRTLSLLVQAQHAWLDDGHYTDRRRSDVTASVAASYQASPTLRVRGRVRYLNEDISDNAYLEQSLWSYGELRARLRAKDALLVRGDLFVWLDDRASTARRTPSPELRLMLGYQAKL